MKFVWPEALKAILLAYKKSSEREHLWCYSQRQGMAGRDQCPLWACSVVNEERTWEALNFSIRLWTAPRRSICITDPGEAPLPRLRLVCVNPLSFSWLPITLCIGNTATERGSGFIRGTPKWYRDKAALMPRDTGTERVNGNRMKPKVEGTYATFSYFTGRKYILNVSSTRVRAFYAAVASRQITQPLGFKYPVWFLASFSLVPAPTGFGPKYSMRLFSGLFSASEVF